MTQTLTEPTGADSASAWPTIWQNAVNSLLTQHAGSARPSYAQAGTLWTKTVSSSVTQFYYYDGTSDIYMGSYDTANHIWNPPVGGGTSTLASAATVDLGSVSSAAVTISGTTTITSFGTSMLPGQIKFVTFSGVLTLTYNVTSMILPGAANIVTSVGDATIVQCVSSGNYKILAYQAAIATNVNATSINGCQLAGLRNRIINGDMRIDQRNAGASQTITAAAAAAYTVDRFYATCTGANVAGGRVAGAGADQYNYQFTGAASVTAIAFGQRIEATNIYDLAGTTATLSFETANSVLTTVNWTAYYPTSIDNWTSRTLIASGSFTVNSTLTKYSTNIALPSNVQAGVEIELSVGAQISGTWKIGNLQLEPGTIATPFERRPIALEMALCLRYFLTGLIGATGWANTATNLSLTKSYPNIMRSTPTITYSGTSYTNCGSLTTQVSDITGFYATVVGTTSGGSNCVCTTNLTASAEL